MNLVFSLLIAVAHAAAPEAYPLQSELALPAEGVSRVTLPPELVGVDPAALGRTLRVQNAEGVEVPFAPLLSTQNPSPTEVELDLRPVSGTEWVIDGAERPVDFLRFDVAGFSRWPGVWATVATVDWAGTTVFLYDGEFDGLPFTSNRVDVGHRQGPFLVTLRTIDGRPERLWDVEGFVEAPEFTPPRLETLAPGEAVLTEGGGARWTVRLPSARAVTAIRVLADGDVFRRLVRVGVPEAGTAPSLRDAGTIRRLQVGEAKVDQNRVEVDLRGDTLIVEIETDRGVPLPVTAFEVESVGAEIVVRAPGAAPQLLLGGTYDSDQAHDLSYAAVELLRGEVRPAVAPPPVPNPGYVPLPTREGLDGAGATVNLARFRYVRTIEGAPGWVTLPLDAEVLGHARADLGDLRVVDAAGRAIPFLLRSLGAETPLEVSAFQREEIGGHSQIRVPLPSDGAPLATVTLVTPQARFRRTLSILRDRGRMTEPVRSLEWQSEAVGSSLAVSLYDHFGRELLIDIDNGDNPPLPLDRVVLTTPAWELRTRLPEGGARLVYGAAGERAPAWDLGLLGDEVWRMPLSGATLGVETTHTGPSLSALEQLVVVGAIGVLALGLVGMTIRALRTADPEAPGSPDAPRGA